jgi:Flp pilus assembly protein TadD
MEYIAPDEHGRVTLADHLRHARGPLDTDRALAWAIQFCYGMEHANGHGIKCHRDIKPANLLIRQDGTLLISDFGLAAAAEAAWKSKGQQWETGSWEGARDGGGASLTILRAEGLGVVGTPGYMAPEVFGGQGAGVQSDVYSFGLVLWQMAAGSQVPPFARGVAPPRNERDIERYASEIYERQMREHAPTVGEPFKAVIERCLAPEPSRRFASFTQLRAELEPILNRRTGRTVKLSPASERNAAFWSNRGVSLSALGRHDEAIACLRKALEIDPDFAAAHINLGATLKDKGDLEGAIAEFRAAIRLRPDYADAHINLGAALKDKGDLDGAIAEFRMALRLQPDEATAHNNLGAALCKKGDLDGAIPEWRAAVRLQPELAEAHYNLGSALRNRGDNQAALAEFHAAYLLAPNNPTVRGTYEKLMQELKR